MQSMPCLLIHSLIILTPTKYLFSQNSYNSLISKKSQGIKNPKLENNLNWEL